MLDKENILPEVPESTDADYHVKKPSEAQFQACANEFWWCSNNIAKGLWREEMPYVQDMTNFVVRKQLEKMLSWKAGIRTDFQVSVGKSAKYLYRWLEPDEYQGYLNTYFGGSVAEHGRRCCICVTCLSRQQRMWGAGWDMHIMRRKGRQPGDFWIMCGS